jgi:L-lactate dehydrogenase (cytochrome)
VAPAPRWFQVFLWKQRDVTLQLVERAAAAGYGALVVTVDVPVLGRRPRDLRNGMRMPPKMSPGNALHAVRRPRWLYSYARARRMSYANMRGLARARRDGERSLTLAAYREWFDPSRTWADLDWLREAWGGPLIVKGITHPADAIRAADAGVDGIVVSNHGGRQLDCAPAALEALPGVVEAVADRGVQVMLDGGIRRGSDVIKAVALGAHACMIGRPCLWGLAAGGEAGVRRCFEILNTEIDRTLALMGRRALREVTTEDVGQPVAVVYRTSAQIVARAVT